MLFRVQDSARMVLTVDPYKIAHIYNGAIKPVLTYGCAAVGLSDKHVTELEKLQSSLIKTALGLSKFCRNTSLMRAMWISSVKQTIDMQYLSTLKNCITGSSKAKTFYLYQGWGQVLLTKYSKCIPSTSTGQVLIFLKKVLKYIKYKYKYSH